MGIRETDTAACGKTARYILAAAALSLLIVLADIGAYRDYRAGLFAQEQRQLLLMAETVGKSLESYIEDKIEEIDLFFSEREDGGIEELEKLTALFLRENPGVFRAAALIGGDGGTRLSTFGAVPEGLPPLSADNGARILGKALADTGWYELYVQKALTVGGQRVTLLFSLDLHEIYLKIVAPIRIGKGGYSVVKDRDLAIIMHHAKSQIGMDAIYDRSQRYPDLDLSSLKDWLRLQTQQEEGVGVINSYVWDDPALTPIQRIAAYSTIHIQDEQWIVNSTLPVEELSAPLRQMAAVMLTVTLLCFGAITVIAVLLTRTLEREEAQEREIRYLRQINQGMELTAKQSEQIRHYQRVQSLGMMASHIAHEFNNYLTPIAVYAELMADDDSISGENRAMLREMLGSIETAKTLSRSLLDYSRQDSGAVLKPLNLTEDTKDAFAVVRHLTPRAVKLSASLPDEPLMILGREGMMQSVLMNLCKNAFSAMENTPKKELHLSLERDEAAKEAVLRVRDSGCGISEEARQRIFEPFYTTKGSRQGTGLGLSVVQNVINGVGGHIDIQSEPDRGTEFVLHIPLLDEAAAAHDLTRKILYVGKSGAGMSAVRAAVPARPGCRAEYLAHPGAVIAELQKDPACCELVIAEYILPAMNGVELLEIVRQLNARIRLLLVVERTSPDLEWYVNNRIIDGLVTVDSLKTELEKLLQ